VSEDVRSCGITAEVAALVAEEALFHLDAPIRRVAVPDTPIPFAPVMERAVIPQVDDILDAVRSVVS
jgi:pyruvate/2-oxoglutarate/acetoin dehydrogenase E1 component